MSDATPAERAAELRREIAEADHRYYELDDPTIGDDEYDALMRELRAIEEDDPEPVTADSPTQRVGGRADRPLRAGPPSRADALARQRPRRRRVPRLGGRGC